MRKRFFATFCSTQKNQLYGCHLSWLSHRDQLDASFCRMGSGFLTPSILNDAEETSLRINQILTRCRLILETDKIPPLEPPHLPMLEAQKSVPIYAHSKGGGNQLS